MFLSRHRSISAVAAETDLTEPTRHLHHAIQVVLTVGIIVSAASLTLRLWAKYHACKKLYIEDLILVCLSTAWVFCTATQTLILYALNHAGLGKHIRYLTENTINTYEKLFLAAACLFVTGLCLARLSHLIFLNRLMNAKKWLRRALLGVTALTIVGSTTIVCCFVFACRPISKSWNVTLAGKCIDRTAIFIAVAVQNIVSDILLIALPGPIIYELHLPRAEKFRFTILLVLICITFVASAIRLRVTVPMLGSIDSTYEIAPVALLVGIECSLIILAASLPALRQCCRLLTASLKSSSHQGATIAHPPGDPNGLVRTENSYLPPRPCEMPRRSVPSRVALGREEARLSISYR